MTSTIKNQNNHPISADEFSSLMSSFAIDANAPLLNVAVGVSGGADSMALMLLVDAWAKSRGGSALGITIDHCLRDNSSLEALQVASWLKQRAINHKIVKWENGCANSGGVQARAREARYQLMADVCGQNRIKHLLVAHNMEDQAETFIMRLRHKSGLDGLGAMAKERKLDGNGSVTVVRPLLGIAKHRLKDTLELMGQPWVEDPSNRNHKFERVRIRELLAQLQTYEGITPLHFARAADGVRALRNVFDIATDKFISTHVRPSERQKVSGLKVNLGALLSLDRQIMARVLSRVIGVVGKGGYPPSGEKITRILDWLAGETSASGRTLGGCKISKNGDFLLIKPELGRQKAPKPMVNSVTYQRLSQKSEEKLNVSLVAGH